MQRGLRLSQEELLQKKETIRSLYFEDHLDGVQISKRLGISQSSVYQYLGKITRYCTRCRVVLNPENEFNTRRCRECHGRDEQEKEYRHRAYERVRDEIREIKLDRKLEIKKAKELIITERKKQQREKISRECFACKEVFFRERRDLSQGKPFCTKCRTHLFRNSTLLGGRDRTREIRRLWDGYTCQECKTKWRQGQRRFDVHHLGGLCGKLSKSYDSYDMLPKLTTFCHRCHMSKHVLHSQMVRQSLSKENAAIRAAEIRRLLNEGRKTREEIAAWYGFKQSNLVTYQ